MNASSLSRSLRFQLNTTDAVSLGSKTSSLRVTVESGFAWITVAGEQNDIVLSAGQERWFPRDRHVVLQALLGTATVVSVTPC